MNLAISDQYVFVCPQFGHEFETLEDYLEYSEGVEDCWISDTLGASFHFDSIDSYQQWVRDELLAKGKTLKQWVREQQTLETNKNYNHDKATGILLCCHTGRRQLFRLSSRNFREFARRANTARKVAFAQLDNSEFDTHFSAEHAYQ
ncbi:hypothetical protein H6G91_17165 [Nostoc muscorum FACHB-395]|jgi:hypothetical protein|nr:hypothetical protein [Desmonostoc muscorum FACHB-395]